MYIIGAYSYITAAIIFLAVFSLIVLRWRARSASLELALAMLVGCAWALVSAFAAFEGIVNSLWSVGLEIVRNLVWGYLLLKILRLLNVTSSSWYQSIERITYGIPIVLLALLLFVTAGGSGIGHWLGYDLRIVGHLLMSLTGLILVEQIFRGSKEQRWAFKFLCSGFGGIYLFEFYVYSEALLFSALNANAWASRGFVVAISLILAAIGMSRLPVTSLGLNLSRPMVFYATGLVFAGIYLLIVAGGGYYLQLFGGDWGGVIRNTFIFAALLFLLVTVSSGTMRSRLRVYIDKHFLNYKYDYREEWLRLIRQLSSEQDVGRLEEAAVKALADMMDSDGGVLLVRQARDVFQVVARTGLKIEAQTEPADGAMIQFLEQWQWVINMQEFHSEPDLYQGLVLPEWIQRSDNIWLVVPLMLQARLYGFVVLGKPRAEKAFNWEDIDLLKTAGRQVAIHLAQAGSALALVEARQFEAFNRLSAYVMHDLKNLMSQLGLVVKNAEKHKSNPAFVDDAINTVNNAVERMNRLLAQLQAGMLSSEKRDLVELSSVLELVVQDKSRGTPVPHILQSIECFVEVDRDRLVSIIGHIVQNAQDATPTTGFVHLSLGTDSRFAMVTIEDNGSGMEEAFIKNRLFKPFDSTKGLTGMGIGAHEVRHFIEDLGGSVDVESQPGKGTTFRLKIPIAKKR